MALTPLRTSTIDRIIEIAANGEAAQPSRTYEFDFDRGEFTNQMIDREEALKQYIIKMLSTPRFRYLIYDSSIGNEVQDLIGEDVTFEFLKSEIPRLIKEALIFDERIEDVFDFAVSKDPSRDEVFVFFRVKSVEGFVVEIEEVKF